MTDRARELLERCAFQLGNENMTYWNAGLVEEIRAYLAQPEVKRERLSEKEIETEYWDSIEWTSLTTFLAGVRFAEKHHGIGGRDE